jgi:hypothetical protein
MHNDFYAFWHRAQYIRRQCLASREKDINLFLHRYLVPAPTQPPGAGAIRQPPGAEPAERSQGTQATQSEDPQHRDKLIVLDVSKEQLEAAPAYRKLGEEVEN